MSGHPGPPEDVHRRGEDARGDRRRRVGVKAHDHEHDEEVQEGSAERKMTMKRKAKRRRGTFIGSRPERVLLRVASRSVSRERGI